MDPVTINLPDVVWGPYAWLAAYVLGTGFLGLFSRRHIRLAGITKGDEQGSHTVAGIVSGILGIVAFIVTLCSSNSMFNRSIVLADNGTEQRMEARCSESVSVDSFVNCVHELTAGKDRLIEAQERLEETKEEARLLREQVQADHVVAATGVSGEIANKCTCGAPLDEDGHCERLIAQFGKQTVEKVACATEGRH